MNQTLLAFDYGTRKIGVAAGQDVTGTAQGIATIATRSKRRQWDEIETLIRQWQPDKLVVGLPVTGTGGESAMTVQARRFGKELERRFDRAVLFVDETLTSDYADSIVRSNTSSGKRITPRRHALRDMIAAELILQTYLHECACS